MMNWRGHFIRKLLRGKAVKCNSYAEFVRRLESYRSEAASVLVCGSVSIMTGSTVLLGMNLRKHVNRDVQPFI